MNLSVPGTYVLCSTLGLNRAVYLLKQTGHPIRDVGRVSIIRDLQKYEERGLRNVSGAELQSKETSSQLPPNNCMLYNKL